MEEKPRIKKTKNRSSLQILPPLDDSVIKLHQVLST